MGWGARLSIGFALLLAGAAAATWSLAHIDGAARLVGVQPDRPLPAARLANSVEGNRTVPSNPAPAGTDEAETRARVAELEQRLARVENAASRTEGSVGRADGLVVAVAARRAIDRGVALGYLENLLVERYGRSHQQAVATIVTGARQPVRLYDLIADYEDIGPELRRGGTSDGWWNGVKRELGSLVEVHSAKRPSLAPDARFERAMHRLQSGDVDQALTETMRMPGARAAERWVTKARRYVAVHRALDELESAALMPQRA